MQLTDQTLLVLSESYALWKKLVVLYHGGEQVPHTLFCTGGHASNDGLHGLHGYLECTLPLEDMAPLPDQNWSISEQLL